MFQLQVFTLILTETEKKYYQKYYRNGKSIMSSCEWSEGKELDEFYLNNWVEYTIVHNAIFQVAKNVKRNCKTSNFNFYHRLQNRQLQNYNY